MAKYKKNIEELTNNLRYQLSRISSEIYESEDKFSGITLDESSPAMWLKDNITDLDDLKAKLQAVPDEEAGHKLSNFTIQHSLNIWVDDAIELSLGGDVDN